MLVRNIDEISLKTIETKQGRMPSVKLDLDEQIEKLHKINEYCCKLENQKTALK